MSTQGWQNKRESSHRETISLNSKHIPELAASITSVFGHSSSVTALDGQGLARIFL